MVIHYDTFHEKQWRACMHIRRVQGIIQMYTEDPKFWPLHCTLQKSLAYYLDASNTAISCHSENKLWPPVLHLFVMADLQGGMIYLKIRTSSKMHEVPSTFQLKSAVRCHEQNYSWFWTRQDFWVPTGVWSNWELPSSAHVCKNTERTCEFDQVPGRTGESWTAHLRWAELHKSSELTAPERGHNMAVTTPNTRQLW